MHLQRSAVIIIKWLRSEDPANCVGSSGLDQSQAAAGVTCCDNFTVQNKTGRWRRPQREPDQDPDQDPDSNASPFVLSAARGLLLCVET